MSLKQEIIRAKYFPSGLMNKIIMRLKGKKFGRNLKTYGCMFIRGTGSIIIGNDVTITSCRETNPIGGDTKTILFAKNKSKIIIGNHVGLSNASLVAMNSIVIDNDVLIGGGCKIYDHDFHSLDFETRNQSGNAGVIAKPVHIKRGAFIGAHSIILKGVTIGEESIIGAGSVVTKDIPDGEIWAGNPAKYIRGI
jgi:acetyltransferase-like isoleucine patch superfamily enzyme